CYRGLSRMAKSPCPDQKSSPKRRTAAIPIASVFDIMVRSWPNKGHDWFGCGCSPEMKQASSNAATHADGESHVEHQNVGQGGVLGPGVRVRSALASHRRAEGSAGNPDPSVPGIDARERGRERSEAPVPAQELRDARPPRVSRLAGAEGTRRDGPEPCRGGDDGGNDRPLRLPVDRHVLHHASRRRGRGGTPPP